MKPSDKAKQLQHQELGLLDEYAGQAMAGFLANPRCQNRQGQIGRDAFNQARYMLIERRKALKEIEIDGIDPMDTYRRLDHG